MMISMKDASAIVVKSAEEKKCISRSKVTKSDVVKFLSTLAYWSTLDPRAEAYKASNGVTIRFEDVEIPEDFVDMVYPRSVTYGGDYDTQFNWLGYYPISLDPVIVEVPGAIDAAREELKDDSEKDAFEHELATLTEDQMVEKGFSKVVEYNYVMDDAEIFDFAQKWYGNKKKDVSTRKVSDIRIHMTLNAEVGPRMFTDANPYIATNKHGVFPICLTAQVNHDDYLEYSARKRVEDYLKIDLFI